MPRISRRTFLTSSLAGVAAAAVVRPQRSRADGETRPTPSPQQVEWQDCELGTFFHYDMPVFKPDWALTAPLPDAKHYDPEKLDTDQWLDAARSMGSKYAVLVAKHDSGFLQWQSDLYPYGVRQSPWRGGKGDLVKDFVASCERHKIRPGIYASVTTSGYWQVGSPGRINWGKGGDQDKQAAYARVCEKMLAELWGNYGELFHLWFDGGALPPDQGGPDLLPLLKKLQPKANVFQGPAATVRWVGNEDGTAGYPCWATAPRRDYAGGGEPDGELWLPAECDTPLPGHRWLWTPDQNKDVEPLPRLMEMYYQSVGRNGNLLLNATPGPDGLIPEANLKHYAAFGKEIGRRFDKPLAETKGEGRTVELKLPSPQRVDHVVCMEDVTQGERVRAYVVEGRVAGDSWEKLCEGVSIGHKRIQQFPAKEVAAVRLSVTKDVASPVIRKLAAYRIG